jgi:hypothetical protein
MLNEKKIGETESAETSTRVEVVELDDLDLDGVAGGVPPNKGCNFIPGCGTGQNLSEGCGGGLLLAR